MTTDRKTSTNPSLVPRVFLSYARSDGEQFAACSRKRLEDEHIPLWQDRIGMEGGLLDALPFMPCQPLCIKQHGPLEDLSRPCHCRCT
jgi:hypothetical protein